MTFKDCFNPKISIITVTKNSEKFIERNILSVIGQSYKNYEHIIIDGNSSDKTMEISTIKILENDVSDFSTCI